MKSPLDRQEAEVVRVKRQTHDTVTLSLTTGSRFDFRLGQYNMVGLTGVGEVPVSISSGAAEGAVFDHTIRDVGSVTGVLCGLMEGDRLLIRGPYGNGWPVEKAAGMDLVVVAGGIGLAPLRGVIEEVLKKREKYGRFDIVYGARTPDDLLFRDEFEGWKERGDNGLLLSVDRVRDGETWKHNVGVVITLFGGLRTEPENSLVFTCGPEIMMRFVARSLVQRGYAPQNIYVSLERRMRCGIGHCGHCQLGPRYVCVEGPVFRHVDVKGYPDSIV